MSRQKEVSGRLQDFKVYLSVPLATEKLRSLDYSPLVDFIIQCINSWLKKTLSYAGKIQLIGSVLQGVKCLWFSILPLPYGIVDRIYNICKAFMWTGKHPLIS